MAILYWLQSGETWDISKLLKPLSLIKNLNLNLNKNTFQKYKTYIYIILGTLIYGNSIDQLNKLDTNPLELSYILFHSEPIEGSVDS